MEEAQRHAQAALQAGLKAQVAQIEQAQKALDAIPAKRSQSVRRELDYSVEHWTRTCEVFAWVSWEDASGRQHTERVHQQATVTDTANQAYPEAGIAEDLRQYGVLDEELIARADLALVGDIRALIAAGALADETLADTGR